MNACDLAMVLQHMSCQKHIVIPRGNYTLSLHGNYTLTSVPDSAFSRIQLRGQLAALFCQV